MSLKSSASQESSRTESNQLPVIVAVYRPPKRSKATLDRTFQKLFYQSVKKNEGSEASVRPESSATASRITPRRLEQLLGRLAQHPKRLATSTRDALSARSDLTTTINIGSVLDRRPPPYNPRTDPHLALYWARRLVLAESALPPVQGVSPPTEHRTGHAQLQYSRAPLPTHESLDGAKEEPTTQPNRASISSSSSYSEMSRDSGAPSPPKRSSASRPRDKSSEPPQASNTPAIEKQASPADKDASPNYKDDFDDP